MTCAYTRAPMTEEGELDFEKADFVEPLPPLACTACKQAIVSTYHEINGRPLCASCRVGLDAHLARAFSLRTFGRAALYGGGAAAAGSIAWHLITKWTGYELAIVAIGIGIAVGHAVRAATYGMGGRRYQALAMFLTYSAIVLTYVPMILEALKKGHPAAPVGPPPTLTQFVLAWALLIGIAYVAPFLAGVKNILGLLIIGIGLYEAWKYTRAAPLVVRGPLEPEAPPIAPKAP